MQRRKIWEDLGQETMIRAPVWETQQSARFPGENLGCQARQGARDAGKRTTVAHMYMESKGAHILDPAVLLAGIYHREGIQMSPKTQPQAHPTTAVCITANNITTQRLSEGGMCTERKHNAGL
jgi:hypothetical protein